MFNDNFLATLTYFETRQENVARADDNSIPTEIRYIGTEGIESSGIEFDLAGELLPGLQTSIGFTHFNIDVDDEIDANVADYTPEKLLKLAATYNVPQVEGLTVGINLRWQDDISRSQGFVGAGLSNSGEEIITKQDAYALVGLMARYEFNDQVSLAINAYNVTDEKYINSLYWAQGYYGAPASYSATVSFAL